MLYKSYPKYKDSGAEWIGEIPEGWVSTQLKRMSSLYGRIGWRGLTTNDYVEEGYGLLGVRNISENGELLLDNLTRIPYEKYMESPEIMINEGDILLAKTGATIGKSCVIRDLPEPMTINAAVNIFRVKSNVLPDFFERLISSVPLQKQMWVLVSENARGNLFQRDIKDIIGVVPLLPEQRTIATFLDRRTSVIDSIIEKKRRQIELLKEKRTALITKAVTKGLDPDVKMKDSGIEWLGEIPEHWDVVRLTSIGDFSKGSGIACSDIIEKGCPAISYGDIYTTYNIRIEKMKKYISKEKSKSAVPIFQDDILMTGSGETVEEIGKAVVYLGKEKAYAGGDIIIFKHKRQDGLFLSYSLNSAYSIYQKSREAKGNIIIHTYASNLREILTPLPPFNEQKKISSYLENYSNLVELSKRKINNSISKLQEYRSALITAAVTGKIDVREEGIKDDTRI